MDTFLLQTKLIGDVLSMVLQKMQSTSGGEAYLGLI
jgi:hypothetical protein